MWGVEEVGLFGSKNYVKVHADELSNIRFYLNMDMCGIPTRGRDILLNEWPDLKPLVENWRDHMGLDFKVSQSVSAFSDHFNFFVKGVPTGALKAKKLSLTGRGFGHTSYDTVDKINIRDLREASRMAAGLALRMANHEDWPVTRRSEEIVVDLLNTPDYQQEQAFRNRLKAFYAEIATGRTDF
jgi:Zn-dependent M28 family amino/carboxypeptidase